MNFTKADYETMNSRVRGGSSPTIKAKGKIAPRPTSMNKTEASYSHYLEALKRSGEILDYKFEGLKFKLADNTSLTPDFMVITQKGYVELHDTKARWASTGKPHVEDDFMVKIKVAAIQYPYFTFCITWLENGSWMRKDY
jgi:hypothetical protein